ncbi:hypothetical protein D3C73_185180 [compost metagenome]
MEEDTTILDIAHEVVERFANRQASMGAISAQELDYAVLAQEVIALNQQFTKKDATIKELQEAVGRPKLHLLSELHNERIKREGAFAKSERLRKALGEAKLNIRVIDEYGEDTWAVTKYCDAAIEEINSALGEGDKQ